MSDIIKVSNLQKNYGRTQAVKNVSFHVKEGELLSFLGPNGAGKSTTINILCTLLSSDGGSVMIDGKKLGKEDEAIRRQIGVVFQHSMLDDLLSVEDNLKIRAGFYFSKTARVKEAVRQAAATVQLQDVLKRPYGKLSGGQRRRADIARALLHTPKLLFLDEPTTGLDPQTRRNVWETVRALQKEQGMTVFLTTHYMEEAAGSDYVEVIDHGVITASGTPAELKEQYAHDSLRLSVSSMESAAKVLGQEHILWQREGGQMVIALSHTKEALPILKRLEGQIESFEVIRGTMDDVFLGITGEEIRP